MQSHIALNEGEREDKGKSLKKKNPKEQQKQSVCWSCGGDREDSGYVGEGD